VEINKPYYLLKGLNRLLLLIPFLILFGNNQGFAQVSFSGSPLFTEEVFPVDIPIITLPGVDVIGLRTLIEKRAPYLKTLPVALDIPVAFNFENSGQWSETEQGTKVWRIGFYSPGARSIAITFSSFEIPSEARLFICSPDGGKWIGAFTHRSRGRNSNLSTSDLPGDTIIIEYQIPGDLVDKGDLEIGLISHGLHLPIMESSSKDSLAQHSGFCNVDINCSLGDDWQIEKRSVCRILVHKFDTLITGDTIRWSEICSGVLVNNTRNDRRPLVLTANHCITNEYEAEFAVFYFGYESPWCDGPDGTNKNSLFGSALLATSDRIDFSIIELDQSPPLSYNAYFAGWNRGSATPLNTVCIHHPKGDVKKISIDNDPPLIFSYSGFDENAFWLIQKWEVGTTEPGSSGSPLFDPNHYVTGLLSGGSATCINPVTDYFCRLSEAWDNYPDSINQLKYWLDPDGLGQISIPGNDPARILQNSINIYPNPSSGDFTLELKDINKQIYIRMYDLSGKLVFASKKHYYERTVYLTMSWLRAGVYILRVNDGSSILTRKIVITNE